jgi:hypothetical protein
LRQVALGRRWFVNDAILPVCMDRAHLQELLATRGAGLSRKNMCIWIKLKTGSVAFRLWATYRSAFLQTCAD